VSRCDFFSGGIALASRTLKGNLRMTLCNQLQGLGQLTNCRCAGLTGCVVSGSGTVRNHSLQFGFTEPVPTAHGFEIVRCCDCVLRWFAQHPLFRLLRLSVRGCFRWGIQQRQERRRDLRPRPI
jgi:hypothetical protein